MPTRLEVLSKEHRLPVDKVVAHYLNKNNLVKSRTAKDMGIDGRTLDKKITEFGIRFQAVVPQTNNAQSNDS